MITEEQIKKEIREAEMFCIKNKYNPNQLVFIKQDECSEMGEAIPLKHVLHNYITENDNKKNT